MLTKYFEFAYLILSGDKQYAWNYMQTDRVVDIHNGLETLFNWPVEEINTHMHASLDLMNVNED
mgnify:CR=1 FL=1